MNAAVLLALTKLKAPYFDYHALAPELILSATIVVMLIVDLFVAEGRKYLVGTVAGLGLLCSMIPIVTLALQGHHDREMFGGAYVVDPFALALKALFILTGYIVLLISTTYIEEGGHSGGHGATLTANGGPGRAAPAREAPTVPSG